MDYDPFKTAIRRGYLSRPMKELLKRDLLKGDILEYGCGHGLDSEWLWKDYNIQTWRYDKYNEKFKDDFLLDEKYDTVTSLYTLNVMPNLDEHSQVVQLLRELGKDVYIAVRSDRKAIKKSWMYDEEGVGYWTSAGTYQRFYNEELIDRLIGSVEYIVNNSELKLFKLN